MILRFEPEGTVTTVYTEALDLAELGHVSVARASHVEPTPDGLWTADLSPVDGPVLGPFAKRSEALAAEVAWLERWLMLDNDCTGDCPCGCGEPAFPWRHPLDDHGYFDAAPSCAARIYEELKR